jgi:hypothetical protein
LKRVLPFHDRIFHILNNFFHFWSRFFHFFADLGYIKKKEISATASPGVVPLDDEHIMELGHRAWLSFCVNTITDNALILSCYLTHNKLAMRMRARFLGLEVKR